MDEIISWHVSCAAGATISLTIRLGQSLASSTTSVDSNVRTDSVETDTLELDVVDECRAFNRRFASIDDGARTITLLPSISKIAVTTLSEHLLLEKLLDERSAVAVTAHHPVRVARIGYARADDLTLALFPLGRQSGIPRSALASRPSRTCPRDGSRPGCRPRSAPCP